jgi:nicotinate dehydrogenase subunit A
MASQGQPSSVVELEVNGTLHRLATDPETPLLFALRNDLGLTAAKLGCGVEQCGCCVVLVDGQAVTSCATPIGNVEGRAITTLEGIGGPCDLHPVQRAFLEEQAGQCGYCVPGIIVSAVALLEQRSRPSEEAIREALGGHLCRCGSHPRIVNAVKRAAAEITC